MLSTILGMQIEISYQSGLHINIPFTNTAHIYDTCYES